MQAPSPFDDYAARYDADFTWSCIGLAQRRQVWRKLEGCLAGVSDILEINCGTGEDALELGRRGFRVVATDASPAMLQVAGAKQKRQPASGAVEFRTAGFPELEEKLGCRRFDLIFSNFGGLNCIGPSDTRETARQLALLLRPGGRLFLVYLSPHCLWEQLYYLWKRDPARARRRQSKGSVTALVEGQAVGVWYYAVRRLAGLYQPWFRLAGHYPVGLFVPPSDLKHFFERHPVWLEGLEQLDRLLAFPWFANLADHLIAVFEKESETKPSDT